MGAFRREEKTCFQWPETVPQGPGRRRPARAPAPLRAQLTSPARGHTSRAGAVSGISPHSEHPVRTKPIPGLSRRGGGAVNSPTCWGLSLPLWLQRCPPATLRGVFRSPAPAAGLHWHRRGEPDPHSLLTPPQRSPVCISLLEDTKDWGSLTRAN